MALPPGEIAKLLPKETVDKIYDDALSDTAKELSKLGVSAVKTARLVLLPLQITAALQDRVEAMLERISRRIPEHRQIEARPELVGPALEKMRYLSEKSELWRMYEEVITKSVDVESNESIHPSFPHIISQLSRDEAWILYRLRDREFNVIDTMDFNETADRFENRQIEQSELPMAELFLPDQIGLYYAHLESLSLVVWPVLNQTPIHDTNNRQVGVRRQSRMMLTDFGKLFVSVCIPEDGFEPKRNSND